MMKEVFVNTILDRLPNFSITAIPVSYQGGSVSKIRYCIN